MLDWDGRRNDAALKNRPPNGKNPRTLGVEIVRESASPVIKTFAHQLGSALAAGDITSAQALFSDDALYEDMTTRTLNHRTAGDRPVPVMRCGTGSR